MRTIKQIETDIITVLNINAKTKRELASREKALQDLIAERQAALGSMAIKEVDGITVLGEMDGKRFVPKALGTWGDEISSRETNKIWSAHSKEPRKRLTAAQKIIADKYGEDAEKVITLITRFSADEKQNQKHGYLERTIKMVAEDLHLDLTIKQLQTLIS